MNIKDIFSKLCFWDKEAETKPTMHLRFSSEDDTNSLIDYYQQNSHQHVHIRRRDWIEQHASAGQFLMGFNDEDEIIASSALYDYFVEGDNEETPSYYEVGSTNFRRPGGNGFDLYPLFISSQVIDAFLTMPPQEQCIANVYNSSPVGRELLTARVGWVTIEATPDILKKFKSTKADDHQNNEEMTWYASKSHCLPGQARIVLDWIEKASATHKKTGETMEIDFSKFSLAQELKPLVEEIAYGEFGRFLEQNDHISLAEAREMLDSYLARPAQTYDRAPGA